MASPLIDVLAELPADLKLWSDIEELGSRFANAVGQARDNGASYRAIATAAGCSLGRVQRILKGSADVRPTDREEQYPWLT